MRILAIGINYAPERTSVAPFTTGLCEHLVSHGNEVTVVTAFPYYPEWRVWDDYRGSLYRREMIHGVEVRRVANFVPASFSAWSTTSLSRWRRSSRRCLPANAISSIARARRRPWHLPLIC